MMVDFTETYVDHTAILAYYLPYGLNSADVWIATENQPFVDYEPIGVVNPTSPSSPTHGVFWPQQPTTRPALSTFNPTHTTAELADQTSETGLLTALHPFIVNGISTTVPARIRVYKSTAQRDADLNRAIGTDPSGDHGLLLEAVTTAGQLSWQVSPGVYVPVAVPQVPVTVTNLSGGSTAVVVNFTAIAME